MTCASVVGRGVCRTLTAVCIQQKNDHVATFGAGLAVCWAVVGTLVSAATMAGLRNFFATLVPGSGNFQLSRLAGYGLGFWVVITIIVSLTLTLTVITSLTVILP